MDVARLFNDLRQNCASVISRVDSWTIAKKQAIAANSASHKSFLADIKSKQAILDAHIKEMQEKLASLKEKTTREAQERVELQETIEETNQTARAKADRLEEIKEKIDQFKHEIEVKKKRLGEQQEKNRLDMEKAGPQWASYQKRLGFDIVGLKNDVIKFVFSNVNDMNWSEEFFFVVDVGGVEYKILECSPQIDYQNLLDYLNESRDFYGFVKMFRAAFVQSAKARNIQQFA